LVDFPLFSVIFLNLHFRNEKKRKREDICDACDVAVDFIIAIYGCQHHFCLDCITKNIVCPNCNPTEKDFEYQVLMNFLNEEQESSLKIDKKKPKLCILKVEVNGIIHGVPETEHDIQCSCGLYFESESQLMKHLRKLLRTTEERTISCEICNKKFYTKNDLSKHKVIHSDEKKFSCTQCEQSFKLKSMLTRHMVVHTGERKHVCSSCNKTFTQRGDLLRHQSIHNDERKFDCTKCERKFRQKAHLMNHIQKIHNKIHVETMSD